jgi:hypothetical protein
VGDVVCELMASGSSRAGLARLLAIAGLRAWVGVSAIPGAATIRAIAVALPDDLHELQDAYPMTWGLWVVPCAPSWTLPS